jgi:hypothetical protein
MTVKNLDILRGDDVFYRLVFTDSDGQPIDITGWKIYFTAKVKNTDSDDDAVIKRDTSDPHEDPTQGIAIIHLTTTDTSITPGKYIYDIQIKKATLEIFTLMQGEFRVNQDITIRTN